MGNERVARWTLRALVGLGLASLLFYFSWWFAGARIASPVLAVGIALAATYHASQMLGAWLVYLSARRRPAPPAPPRDQSVDVFVTACGEDPELVRRALAAATGMRVPHRTFLLDDGDDPRLAALARRLGAGYLTRPGRRDAKAGNLNAALARTDGDVVVVFDVDHVPDPAFLERSLGYFRDPRVGFVQVMLSFGNRQRSWVARAAVEAWLDFHNPTAIGMDGLGSATLFGSNALIRRSALRSIGGYQPGLAEDLATSLALHGAGWRSAYVAEPLAPGMAPLDLPSWFTQQLKWARGVFEVLLTAYPRIFPQLSWGQRLAYAVRSTYYWVGPLVCVHLLLLALALFVGRPLVRADLEQYLIHCVPLAAMFLLIRRTARIFWRHPSTPVAFEWRGILLAYATWPVYTLAWLMAIGRRRLAFRMTPKTRHEPSPLWLLPHVTLTVLLAAGVLQALWLRESHQALLIAGALGQVGLHLGFLFSIGLAHRSAVPERAALAGLSGD